MLSLKNRLKNREDFKKVYAHGKFFGSGDVSLKFANNNLIYTRVGFSVESKYFKTAVKRNRIKRILRDIFQKNLGNIKTGVDIVIFCKIKEDEINYQSLLEKYEKLLKKANLLIEK